MPVTSVIEVQFAMAPGTALVQKRHGGDEGSRSSSAATPGTAEGDFKCLIWSTRPGNELPVLMFVTNNGYGDLDPVRSRVTPSSTSRTAASPSAFPARCVDGNDPVATWHALDRALRYCRRERKPFLLEAMVSPAARALVVERARPRNWNEADCLALFEQKLIDARRDRRRRPERNERGSQGGGRRGRGRGDAGAEADAPTTWSSFTYAPSPVDAVYPEDYTGLPAIRNWKNAGRKDPELWRTP